MVLKNSKIKKILELRSEGLSIRKIAKKLGISPTTVAWYIKNGYSEKKVITKKIRSVTHKKKNSFESDDSLDEPELLNKIILEVTRNNQRPGIVRMVRRYISDPEQSVKKLAEALELAKVKSLEKKIILRNWANHVDVKDFEKYFHAERKEDNGLSKEKEETFLEDFYKKEIERETKYLKLLQQRKQIKDLRRKIGEHEKKPSQDKVPYVVDGILIYVTPQELLDWKKFETEQKRAEEERRWREDERRARNYV